MLCGSKWWSVSKQVLAAFFDPIKLFFYPSEPLSVLIPAKMTKADVKTEALPRNSLVKWLSRFNSCDIISTKYFVKGPPTNHEDKKYIFIYSLISELYFHFRSLWGWCSWVLLQHENCEALIYPFCTMA